MATNKARLLIIMYCISIGLVSPLHSAERQSLDVLEHIAEQYLRTQLPTTKNRQVKITIGYLDQRLNLEVCDPQQIEAFLPPNMRAEQSHIVGIRCVSSKPWSIYIPVTIEITTEVITAKRFIPRGHVITADDLTLTSMNIQRLKRGYSTQQQTLVGQVATIPMVRGSVVSPNLLKKRQIIKRGQVVNIELDRKAVAISSKGVALTDGSLGELIKVKNLSSDKIVFAKVINQTQVRID